MDSFYDDAAGRLVFAYEAADYPKRPKLLTLFRRPLTADYKTIEVTDANRERLELAAARTEAHLSSCGYEVQLYP